MIRAMLEMRIQQHFIDSADLQYQLGTTLARPLDAAVQAILASVTGGGKVLVAGWGASMSLAQYLVGLLVGGFERGRPALPATALMATPLPAFTGSLPSLLERQVQALGQVGDVLVLLSSEGSGHDPVAAVEAAHAGDMTVPQMSGLGVCVKRMCWWLYLMNVWLACVRCSCWRCIVFVMESMPTCWVNRS
jgi:D-sedoheptulose 7-phosphate isomerase